MSEQSGEGDAPATGHFGALIDPQSFCGQQQAHRQHRWVTSQGLYAACSGKACSCDTPPEPTP